MTVRDDTRTLETKGEAAATLLLKAVRDMRLPETVYHAYETFCLENGAEPNKLGEANKGNTAGNWSDLFFETTSYAASLVLSASTDEHFARSLDYPGPSTFATTFLNVLDERIPKDRIVTRGAKVVDRCSEYNVNTFLDAFPRRVAPIVDGNLAARGKDAVYGKFWVELNTSMVGAFSDPEWTKRLLEKAISGRSRNQRSKDVVAWKPLFFVLAVLLALWIIASVW